MDESVDSAPKADHLTDSDRSRLAIYLRILDAEAAGAPWQEVCEIVLAVDAKAEPERARLCYHSHLERARWIAERGYFDLLRSEDF